MATKSFNQLGKLLVGSAANAALRANVDALAVGEVQAFSADGSTPAEGKAFKIYQKTADSIEVSNTIYPAKVFKTTSNDAVAKVQKSIEIAAFPSITAGEVYGVQIRIYNYGSLSPENFYIVDAYDTAVTGDTPTTIMDKLVILLNDSLAREGKVWFTISAAVGVLTVAAIKQPHNSATKPVSDLEFDGVSKEGENGVNVSTNSVPFVKGIGDGQDMSDIEQNLRFHNGDQYGYMAYPNQYNTPVYIDSTGLYDVLHITHNGGRADHVVENQRQEVIIAIDSTLTLTNVNAQIIASINAFLPAAYDLADLT